MLDLDGFVSREMVKGPLKGNTRRQSTQSVTICSWDQNILATVH